jgi:anti-anti-sigma regulatory factor
MEITFSTVESPTPITIMRLSGRLDSSNLGYFMDQSRHAIDGGAQNILLDFSEVPYMSSVGIRALGALYEWLHPVKSGEEQKSISHAVHDGIYHAPHLKLLNPNPSITKTIHLVALDRYLEIYTDEQQALAAF